MPHSESLSQTHNVIILDRPCPQLDQALADLTRQLAAKVQQSGHTLIIIDHREEMTAPFDHGVIKPVVINFGSEQRLNPL